MTHHNSSRPEDRRRSGSEDSPIQADWVDTLPCWFRSEAFPEDLPDPATAPEASPRQKHSRSGRPRIRRASSWMPHLGLNLAGMFGGQGR